MPGKIDRVVLGERIDLNQFVAVARRGAVVEFSDEYGDRVRRSRNFVEKWIDEGQVIYGTTTGFGNLCDQIISPAETQALQMNLIRADAASVGKPLAEEQVRAIMLMMLQNTGQGYSGIRLEVLELLKEFLNRGLHPFVPREGSVGYLTIEANIALVIFGEGRAYFGGQLLEAAEALKLAGLEPIPLMSKEGLALLDGTTSATALGLLALHDMRQAARSADIIAAMTLESLQGQIRHFDQRVSEVRPHPTQAGTADNVRRILADSEIIEKAQGLRLQDALSLRCVPQLHGAARKLLDDALVTFEIELNSCTDNPIIWTDGTRAEAISACNSDSSFVGMAIDSCCIAATGLAKMSERRNNRLIDGSLSGHPWFLVKDPGLNCGLMVPHYSQAGLLNDMKILSHPATVDSIPTCGNQEDYVGMGYNAAKKAAQVAEKLEYVLAIELLSAFETKPFLPESQRRSRATARLEEVIGEEVPVMEHDVYLYPHITRLRELIHSGRLIELVELEIGELR